MVYSPHIQGLWRMIHSPYIQGCGELGGKPTTKVLIKNQIAKVLIKNSNFAI
jgi:hypothetical protein